jgi:cytochrome P450
MTGDVESPLAGVGEPPARSRGPFAEFYSSGKNPYESIPAAAYRQPIHRIKSIFNPLTLVSDPDAVRRVLVENVANYPKNAFERQFFSAMFGAGLLGLDGPLWRVHRKVMAPAFDPRSVAAYSQAMADSAAAFAERWASRPDGAALDIAEEMKRLTLEVICRTMFSDEADRLIDIAGDAMRISQSALDFTVLDFLPVIGPRRMRAKEDGLHAQFAAMDSAIYGMIEARRGNLTAAPRDLLTRLIEAEDPESGVGLSAEEIRDEVMTIFMAGHETTAVTLTWVWYALSRRPEIATRLVDELEGVLGGRPPTHADLAALPYLRAVVEETMRLYPAAPGISVRDCLADDVLAGQPIKAGAQILISPWVLHRHESLWERPLDFDPTRFLPGGAESRPRFAYLPFGAGPRVCIGGNLAMTEASLILAVLAPRFRLALADGARVKLRAVITLYPEDGLPMILGRRLRSDAGTASGASLNSAA